MDEPIEHHDMLALENAAAAVGMLEYLRRLEADAARWKHVQHGFSAMSVNIDGMHYWTWRGHSLLKRGPTIEAAVDAARLAH